MKLKQFIFALVAMLSSFAFTANAQQLLVNCDYNSSTEGWGTTKFSNYAGAYAYATANAKTATIVIEKTNTISGNTFDNNHKNYSRLAVVIKDGAAMGNAASKWDMTYPVTVEPGGTLTCARPASASVSNIHIKNKLIVGAKGATKKAYVNFLSDSYQDCDISIRNNGSIEVYNADFYVQDLDAQGKLTIEDSKVEVDGAFASATSSFYPTTLTNSTITINGNLIDGGLSDFSGGTSNQLGNVKLNNSTLTIKEGDTKVAAAKYLGAPMTATNSTIAVNNLTVADGATLNLNEGSTLEAENITTAGTGSVKIDGVQAEISGGQAFIPVAKIGEQGYETLAAALEATKTMTGDVTVEILDKVTFNQPLIGNYTSINFVGKDTDAEMYLDVQGYITATGKKVSFTDLKLSKSEGGFITNAGFMNVAFGIYDVEEVTYNNCTFINGACASSGDVTFNGCTFYRSHDRYGLWAYGAPNVVVDGCTFADIRGIKLWDEGKQKLGALTVKNTDFSAVDGKPAIVLTSGKSVTLAGNTYNTAKGALELDLDGNPNGTPVTSDVTPVCVNDNGACGVLVDGKIYTTVAQAAEVASSGSTVTLLHNSTETVALPMGVRLNKNNFEAAGVTVAVPVAKIGNVEYATLTAAVEAAQPGAEIVVIADVADVIVPVTKNLTISGVKTLNNVGINAKGADALTVKGLTFTGNSWINSGTAEALTVSGVTATVAPNNTSYTNSRSAFISLGRSEGQELALTLVDSKITVTAAGADAILGWAKITAATITGNVIKGSDNGYFTGADAIKFMSIANGAEFVVNNNEIYSNYNGIVFAQNTTRDNAYSVSADANKFYGGADHIWIEISGGNTVHATVNATSANTVNGNAFTVNDIKHSAVIKNWSSYAGVDVVTDENGKVVGGTLASFSNAESVAEGYEVGTNGAVGKASVAEVNGIGYASFAEAAAAAAQAGSEIKLLANINGDITVPAGVVFNGDGFAVSGVVTAAGEITFKNVTKVGNFGVQYVNTTVNIPDGASLQLTGTGRMVIGHGCTFNITGTITDAKDANVADVTPSLVMPGASFTGAGVTFNVTNAYISAPSSYCGSSKSASATFDFNITNSIWECAGKLAFESQSTAATVNFELKNSVLNTGSHLVFGVSRGEVVIDNSNVNVGKSNQIENQSTMTIKNGSVVNGAVATSSNAKNPGTIIVEENSTYAVTGEFSGSDLGTGTIIIKKGATVSAGSITKANITVDATGMAAGNEVNLTANLSKFAGTLSVINNEKLEAKIVGGKVVLAAKPVAKIGNVEYATLTAAVEAAQPGAEIVVIADVADVIVPVTKNLTISGSATLNNVGINANGADALTVNGLTFTGNSWINSGTAEALTVSGVTATVKPSNTAYTNSRSAFISLGRSEGQELALTVENSNITVNNAGVDAILGWAKITAATITGNVIKGSDNGYFTGADAIKFLSIANGAEFVVNNNEIYSNYNGIVFAQNTTRDNAYSVSADDNKFYGGADHIWIEISGGNTVHATVNAKSANTVNGNAFTVNDIKYSAVIKNWSSYAGVDVVTDENGKVVGGTLASFSNVQSLADGYELDENGVVVKKAAATINGVKYASLGEAVAKLKSGETLVITSDITPGANEFIELNGKTNVTLAAAEGVVIDGNIQVGYHLSHIDNGVDRSASTFTVDGLTVNGTLTVCSNDAALVVKNTKAAQITVKTYREGMDIALNGNIADGSMGTAANSYGMFLVPNETGYNLAVDGNTFQNINSHAFVVQGCGDGSAVTAANSIAVTNNNFETWGTGGKADRAAFKIWADTKYAPAESDLAGTTNAMRELVIAIAAGGNKYLSTAGNTVQFDAYGAAGDAEDFPKPMYAVVKIGEQGYATLAEAVDAATDGATITLLQNVELASTVTVAGKAITLDLNGKTVSGTCNAGQSSLVYIENNAALTVVDSSDAKNGKLTYAKGTSNVGWTVDVKGAFTLEAGTVELTGSDWSIGYAVDVRPNSWGTEYTNPSVFTMNGGKLVSSDGAVRVASSSAEGHKNVAASFVMNGGAIDAVWDGVFVQQSNATYDVLSFTMNGGTIESDLNPVRVYGPAATGYVNGADCMNISFNGGTMTYTGTETREWVIDRILRVGGGSSMETILESGNITATEAFANANALPEGYQWVADGDKYVAAFVPKVAKIGETYYTTLDAAVKAAQAGETVVVLENVEVASGTTITLDGVNLSTLDGVTLTNNGAIDVKGEVSLNIVALADEELNLLDGAIVKNSTVGGSAFVAGAVTFRGANTFAMLYDFGTLTDYYGTTAPMKWIVEEGASVTLTDKARYGLGYGDNVTVNGNIENALAARETVTEADRSLFVHGLVAQESKGWNCNSAMTVKDAYVVIGSNNSFGNKPGNYGGTYTFNFENSVVDASRITFYEALSTTTFTFDGCDVKMGTFMTRDADSKFTLKNSKVLSTTTTNGNDEGNYNKGELTLVNSSLTYSAELKHEDGVINLDCNSVLTAPAISGAGKITVDATGLEGTVTVINGDMANFTGTIEIVGNEYASYSITAEGLVVVIPKVAAIGETAYPTLQAAIEAAQTGETITMLCDVELASAVTIPAGKVVTLDLNGKTVSYTSAVAGEDMITNNGNLTINSSVEGGKITYNNTDKTGKNVTISTISACPGSTLVVNGGTIENTSEGVSSNVNVAYTIDILTNGSLGDVAVTIDGGSVVSTNYIAIRQFNNGTACKNSLTINDGHIYGAKRAVQVHMDNNAAVTAINGGKVEAGEGGYALCNFAATSALEVTGGELIGAVYSASEGFITGGTFSEEPYSGYLADHYVAELGTDGRYNVDVEEGYIAELEIIDGVNYTNDSEKTVGKLTYVRTLPAAGIWYPVFLPFDVPVDALAANFDVARINDLHTNFSEEDGSIEKMWIEYIVKKSGTLPAGKPFLVRAKNSNVLEMSIELENVKLYPASKKSTITVASAITEVTFEGVYESLDARVSTPSTRYMAVNADGVWDEFDGYSLNPFRVMMTLNILEEEYYIKSAASLSVGARVIGEENEDGTTVIYDVEVDRENDGAIYDLQGRRVLETEKGGIYIKGGKKFIAQ